LCFLQSNFKYLTTDRRQRRARKGGSTEIRPSGLMAPWIYDEKFVTGTRFLFGTLPFAGGENDDLEHPSQEQEEWCTMTIGFEFHRRLKNSVATFQAVVPPFINACIALAMYNDTRALTFLLISATSLLNSFIIMSLYISDSFLKLRVWLA
jgi:hypothetical protein